MFHIPLIAVNYIRLLALKVFLIPKNNGPEERRLILYEDSHEIQFCRVCMQSKLRNSNTYPSKNSPLDISKKRRRICIYTVKWGESGHISRVFLKFNENKPLRVVETRYICAQITSADQKIWYPYPIRHDSTVFIKKPSVLIHPHDMG